MHRNRISLIALLFALAFLLLGARLVWLQGVSWEEWERQSAFHRQRVELHAAPRGRILARGGEVLAVDAPTHAVHYSLLEIEKTRAVAQRLARFFRVRSAGIEAGEEEILASLERLRELYRAQLGGEHPIAPHSWVQGLDPDLALQLQKLIDRKPASYPGISTSVSQGDGAILVDPDRLFAGEAGTRRLELLLGQPAGELYKSVSEAYAKARAEPKLEDRRAQLGRDRELLREVPYSVVRAVCCEPEKYPGLRIVEGSKRIYPAGATLCHLLGYVTRQWTKAPAKEKRGLDPPTPWEANRNRRTEFVRSLRETGSIPEEAEAFLLEEDAVGSLGIEQQQDEVLRGFPGASLYGVGHRKLPQYEVTLPAEPGQDLSLTIDLPLCERIRALFSERGNRVGCALIGDPRSGEVYAYLSFPDFDLNTFRNDKAEYARLAADKALFDRPQHAIPPGSTVKPVLALYALEKGLISAGTTHHCSGVFDPRSARHRCNNHAVPMDLDLGGALARSCNTYFFQLGGRVLGAEGMCEAFTRFEICQKSSLLPQSKSDAFNASIGQGSLRVAPLRFYRFVSMLAMRGESPAPHVVRGDAGEVAIPSAVDVNRGAIETVVRGMKACARVGTASDSSIGLGPYDCAVKTGTADTTKPEISSKNASWIIGFAPIERPLVAFVIVVEETSLHGGDASGPIAAGVLEFLERERGMKLRR